MVTVFYHYNDLTERRVASVQPTCGSVRFFMFPTGWYGYTYARVFVLQIRVSCAFPTRCTCVEFKLRMKRESTYFDTHEYSLAAL